MNQKLFLAVVTLSSIFISASLYETFSDTMKLPARTKAIPPHIHALYSKWKATYGKISESPNESVFRLQEFYKSFNLLDIMRAKNPDGVFKLNHLADTTGEEFIAKYANKISARKTLPKQPKNLKSPSRHLGLRVDDYNLDLLDQNHPLRGAVDNSRYIAEPKRSQGLT